MRCKNCGNLLRNSEKFCTICGTYNDPNDNSLEADAKKMTPPPEENTVEEFSFNKKLKEKSSDKLVDDFTTRDDPYIAAFVGEDYKWIVERPFNIYALLLSWIYFLYRKLYIIGSIGLLITLIIVRFIPIIVVPYIVLVMIGSGVGFNKIYLMVVERKVNKIAGSTDSPTDAMELCQKKGGVNAWIPLGIFFIFLVLLVLSYLHVGNRNKSKFWKENGTNMANCKSLSQKVYNSLDESIKSGTVESVSCIVVPGTVKKYNIYLKMDKIGSKHYLYFEQDDEGYYDLQGDTDYISDLEKLDEEKKITETDRQFLITSKELPTKYSAIKDDSDYEDNLIKKGKDNSEKTHFVFTKDDIIN